MKLLTQLGDHMVITPDIPLDQLSSQLSNEPLKTAIQKTLETGQRVSILALDDTKLGDLQLGRPNLDHIVSITYGLDQHRVQVKCPGCNVTHVFFVLPNKWASWTEGKLPSAVIFEAWPKELEFQLTTGICPECDRKLSEA